ncbi:Protein of unknown function [Gryllus bimaculatus]|nr:Protein of unknown function [Gryllus bimaculatus]
MLRPCLVCLLHATLSSILIPLVLPPGSPTLSRKKGLKSNSPACANTGQGDGAATGNYTGGPGPQRGGNYSAPNQAPSFHPYRRMTTKEYETGKR